MTTVKARLIARWTTKFGGEEHTGWLPKGAAQPQPTPLKIVELTLTILEDDRESYILEWQGPEPESRGDRWYPSVEAAVEEATELFGVPKDAWTDADGGLGR